MDIGVFFNHASAKIHHLVHDEPLRSKNRENLLALACPELTEEGLLELYPSEIEELWHGFEEVNAAFLGVFRQIGLIDILIDSLKPILAAEFGKVLLSSTGQSVSS